MQPHKSLIAGMTQAEVRDALTRDPVLLVPMGSLEDQGPVTFMGDYLLAQRIADLAAARATAEGIETLITPTIPFGCRDQFSGTPAGIALSSGTFRLLLSELFEPLVAAGFRRIIVVNGHGGNVEPINEVTNGIYERTGIVIPSIYMWKAGFMMLAELIGMEAAMASGGHGANPLCSVALHLLPDLARPDRAEPPQPFLDVMGLPATGFGAARFRGIEINMPVGVKEISTNGVVGGDTRACNAETGAAITDKLLELIVELARHIATQRI